MEPWWVAQTGYITEDDIRVRRELSFLFHVSAQFDYRHVLGCFICCDSSLELVRELVVRKEREQCVMCICGVSDLLKFFGKATEEGPLNMHGTCITNVQIE